MLPTNEKEARKVRMKAPMYTLVDGALYRKFGIPNEMVSDNGSQFEGEPFRSWCQDLNIKQSFTSVAHPQANGQCEVTNRDIVKGIKACLGLYGNEWVNELPSRVQGFDESSNGEGLCANLDMLEERREVAAIQEAMNKQKIYKYYDKRVKPLSFKMGQYIWLNNEASRAENTGMLGLNWEGPNEIIGTSATGSYILDEITGERVPRTCHATNLKRCYT
ncbi:uncharacterized protein [Rutidosis leptorrhynchoides]|uniref:uncharacterized protein n=1 Tax=Rutidosis leptorrhynchoides TaxID=125765 RepID=UPI003A98EB2F